MKPSVLMGTAALAFISAGAEAFVVNPAALVAAGRTPASRHGARPGRCESFTRAHQRACTCASRSAGLCARSRFSYSQHSTGCKCSACAASGALMMRMQAHGERCGCGYCSSPSAGTPRAFGHTTACECPACIQGLAQTTSCSCAACSAMNRRGRASLTVMAMSDAGQAELGDPVMAFKEKLSADPDSVSFEETMAVIAEHFEYTPKRFINGPTSSDADVNVGSCKIFAFGRIAGLSAAETLACFGEHYRSVVADPSEVSHGNIRAFMERGWEAVTFPDGLSLSKKEE